MRLIDAESLSSMRFTHEMHDSEGRLYVPFDEVAEAIFNAPTIEAEPVKHGRWIAVSDGYGNGDATAHICECSECKDTIWVYKKATRRWNYCPNCGAKMDAEEGEGHEQN